MKTAKILVFIFLLSLSLKALADDEMPTIHEEIEAHRPPTPLHIPEPNDEHPHCLYDETRCGVRTIQLNGDVQQEQSCDPSDPNCCLGEGLTIEPRTMLAISHEVANQTAQWNSGMSFLQGTKLQYESYTSGHDPSSGSLMLFLQYNKNNSVWRDAGAGTQGVVRGTIPLTGSPSQYRFEMRTKAIVRCAASRPENITGAGMAATALPQRYVIEAEEQGTYRGAILKQVRKVCFQNSVTISESVSTTKTTQWKLGTNWEGLFKLPNDIGLEVEVFGEYGQAYTHTISKSTIESWTFSPNESFWLTFREWSTDFELTCFKRDMLYRLVPLEGRGKLTQFFVDSEKGEIRDCN